jgi:hypothetical protein
VVLDGDDRLRPAFIERTLSMLSADKTMVAASGWLQTFGVLESVVADWWQCRRVRVA